ncbi:uncharacterized protein AKAME5_001923400 [Lates japonicus]|uniref:Gypsy retrotransposon integrase-like protein 1 n=1 Tax=Lates japonicus TaxID=270547 RepID=A0AAD3NAE1_LATJO|nr:uncharacterized protein AKAME5_001923400 [Lates japonicus]
MVVEEVNEIRGGKVIEGFVGDEEEFVLDAVLYREPVEDRGNVVSGASADGQLHYICRRRKQGEHLGVFLSFHASEHGGHCGMEKTVDAIALRYFWPGMESDIRKWILECPECQTRRNALKMKKTYIPIEITEPLELVGMDFIKIEGKSADLVTKKCKTVHKSGPQSAPLHRVPLQLKQRAQKQQTLWKLVTEESEPN